MQEDGAEIRLAAGLHARPAALFAQLASSYQSDVWIARASGGVVADAKNVIAVLALDLDCGEGVVVGAEGPDEEQAVEALVEFLD